MKKISNEIKVALVTVVCILALAIISKNVLNVQLGFISLYGPLWVYIAYIVTRDKAKESKLCNSCIYWSLVIIIVTLAILVLYAI